MSTRSALRHAPKRRHTPHLLPDSDTTLRSFSSTETRGSLRGNVNPRCLTQETGVRARGALRSRLTGIYRRRPVAPPSTLVATTLCERRPDRSPRALTPFRILGPVATPRPCSRSHPSLALRAVRGVVRGSPPKRLGRAPEVPRPLSRNLRTFDSVVCKGFDGRSYTRRPFLPDHPCPGSGLQSRLRAPVSPAGGERGGRTLGGKGRTSSG